MTTPSDGASRPGVRNRRWATTLLVATVAAGVGLELSATEIASASDVDTAGQVWTPTGPAAPFLVSGTPMASPSAAQTLPSVRVRPAAGKIVIDGTLDDPGWEGAARLTNFVEVSPGDSVEPEVDTEVLVTYDANHLYVGFIAHDDPSRIRASLRNRNEIFGDDFVAVQIDPFGDQSWAYEIFANPLGVQADQLRTAGGGEDLGFDIVYRSSGRITDTGYQVEIAIPFASLRFPDQEEMTWRVNFGRVRPRGSQEILSWAPIPQGTTCLKCHFGMLEGLEGVRPGGSLEILPSIVGSHSASFPSSHDAGAALESDGVEVQPSLGFRYAFTSGITAEATLNPDFSQVESDVDQIDVNTTFALFFPERRPFFQEGSDLFNTPINAIYTRSINAPQGAAKLTARRGRTSLSYLAARDKVSPILLPFEERSFVGQAGRSISNVFRVRKSFGEGSQVGFLFTDRRLEEVGGSGTTFGADGMVRFDDNYRVEWQLLGSWTREPEAPDLTPGLADVTFDGGKRTAQFDGDSYWGSAQFLRLRRSGRIWNFRLGYLGLSPTFRADNGFVSRNDARGVEFRTSLDFWPSTPAVDRFGPYVRTSRTWNSRGDWKDDHLRLGVRGMLTGQTSFDLNHRWSPERFRGIDHGGVRAWDLSASSAFSDMVQLGGQVRVGRTIARNLEVPEVADILGLGVGGTIKPLPRWTIEPQVQFQELQRTNGERIFSGYILRLRNNVQFTRELSLRTIAQYNDFSHDLRFEPLLTYRVSPYTLFYIGSAHEFGDLGALESSNGELVDGLASTSRQFFAKLQYLFRF